VKIKVEISLTGKSFLKLLFFLLILERKSQKKKVFNARNSIFDEPRNKLSYHKEKLQSALGSSSREDLLVHC